ncbi:hypothetical protein BKA69DRAFT_1123486 [Paraphysoderma sedebokerense]|nr:hypothetical protein BKA69DRAFT_1123486 [Paraphysoderma sedebokerense]
MSQFEGNLGWDDEIRVVKRAPTARLEKSSSAVNAAMRSGVGLVSEKKTAPVNKAHHVSTDHRHIAKVDRETEGFHVNRVEISVARAIMKARQDKGWTQKDLGVKVNEKQTIINDYEAGRAIPNQQILGKLERALGVKLRGKGIGEPLAPKGKSSQK